MQIQSSWAKRMMSIFFGLAMGLLVAECGLRLLGLPRFHKAHSSPLQFWFERDPETGEFYYVNVPSSTIAFVYDSNPRGYFKPGNVVEHKTNSAGFRGPEFQLAKSSHTVRLAFLGDSFTFGEGVHFEDTFPEVTARLLEKHLSGQGIAVQSYNFGVGGYNTAQELFILKKMALSVHPDAIILCYVLNDAEPELCTFDTIQQRFVRRPRESGVPEGLDDPHPPPNLIYHLRVSQVIWRFCTGLERNRQTEEYYHSLYRSDAENWRRTRQALHEMAQICRDENIPLIVMLFPVLYKLNSHYPFRDLHEMVDREIQNTGAQFLDLLPAFTGKSGPILWVHPTDQHPNEKAHAIAARQLAAILICDEEAVLRSIRQRP